MSVISKKNVIVFFYFFFLFLFQNTIVNAGDVCVDCLSFQVESPEPVLWTGNDVPMNIPDNLFTTVKFSDQYAGYVAGGGGVSYHMKASTISGLNRNSFNTTPVIEKGSENNFDECGAWIHGVKLINDVTVRAWYHAESGHCHGESDNVIKIIKSIAYATSTDEGVSFVKPNYPNNLILTGPQDELNGSIPHKNVGAGDFTVIEKKDYYYMFYIAYDGLGGAVESVARSAVSSGGVPGSWYKLHENSFSEPGIGGKYTSLKITQDGVNYSDALFAGVSYNTTLQKFVALTYQNGSVGGFYLAFSDDGIMWTASKFPLVPDGTKWGDAPQVNRNFTPYGYSQYQTIIAPDGSKNWSDTAYIYYVYIRPGENWTQRFFLRSKITMKNNNPPISSPKAITELSRYYSSSEKNIG